MQAAYVCAAMSMCVAVGGCVACNDYDRFTVGPSDAAMGMDAGAGVDAGELDSGVDAGAVEAGTQCSGVVDGTGCPETEGLCCGEVCVDTRSDKSHCGACDNVCSDPLPACLLGSCVQCTSDMECNDDLGCTLDSCNAAGTCLHVPNDGMCDADKDRCTLTQCDPTFGCVHLEIPNGDPCDDGGEPVANACCARFCIDAVTCSGPCMNITDTCVRGLCERESACIP